MVKLDVDKLNNSLSIINEVEKYRCGLGLPVVFTLCTNLAKYLFDRGIGLILIAPKGIGKGEIIKITDIYEHNGRFRKDNLTPTYLINAIRTYSKIEHNRYLDVIVEDLSTIIDNEYYFKAFFDLTSKLIWDLYYSSGTHNKELDFDVHSKEETDIDINGITVICAGTNNIIHRLKKYSAWDTMYKDRFILFYLLRTKEENEYISNKIIDNAINGLKMDTEILLLRNYIRERVKPIFPDNIPNIKLSKEVSKDELVKVYRLLFPNFTESRGLQYFLSLLKANAYINNRNEIIKDDLRFFLYFLPYLIIDNRYYREQELIQLSMFIPDIYELSNKTGMDVSYIRKLTRWSTNGIKSFIKYDNKNDRVILKEDNESDIQFKSMLDKNEELKGFIKKTFN